MFPWIVNNNPLALRFEITKVIAIIFQSSGVVIIHILQYLDVLHAQRHNRKWFKLFHISLVGFGTLLRRELLDRVVLHQVRGRGLMRVAYRVVRIPRLQALVPMFGSHELFRYFSQHIDGLGLVS